jgi:hypothetical protein
LFEKKALGRKFGPKEEASIGQKELHSEQLHNSYSSPYIVRMIKSRKIK